MSSPDEGDAEAGAKVTADSGVRLLPLVGEFGSDGAEDGFGLPAEAAVGGRDKGSEVPALGLARFEALSLFALLVFAED